MNKEQMDALYSHTSCTYVLEGFVQICQPAHTAFAYLIYLVWYHRLVIWFLLQVLLDRLQLAAGERRARVHRRERGGEATDDDSVEQHTDCGARGRRAT